MYIHFPITKFQLHTILVIPVFPQEDICSFKFCIPKSLFAVLVAKMNISKTFFYLHDKEYIKYKVLKKMNMTKNKPNVTAAVKYVILEFEISNPDSHSNY